jgi:hypothetical protein
VSILNPHFERNRRHRHADCESAPMQIREPASMFHLLASDHELRDAVHRAAEFDRAQALLLVERAEHYEQLVPSPAAIPRADEWAAATGHPAHGE